MFLILIFITAVFRFIKILALSLSQALSLILWSFHISHANLGIFNIKMTNTFKHGIYVTLQLFNPWFALKAYDCKLLQIVNCSKKSYEFNFPIAQFYSILRGEIGNFFNLNNVVTDYGWSKAHVVTLDTVIVFKARKVKVILPNK